MEEAQSCFNGICRASQHLNSITKYLMFLCEFFNTWHTIFLIPKCLYWGSIFTSQSTTEPHHPWGMGNIQWFKKCTNPLRLSIKLDINVCEQNTDNVSHTMKHTLIHTTRGQEKIWNMEGHIISSNQLRSWMLIKWQMPSRRLLFSTKV